MEFAEPFNLNQWIAENKHLLKPPIANKNLYPLGKDYIVMIVGGPNARKDFHYNETEELFYQIEGTANVRIQLNGTVHEKILNAGDMFLLPAKIPHSPVRSENSVGLVIERVRAGKGFTDGLFWYCENCNNPLHQAKFELNNIETDFLTHFKHFYTNQNLRTCSKCSQVMETDPKFI